MDTQIIQSQSSSIQINNLDLLATQPGQLRVIRRNGELALYDETRIEVAIKKAFLAVEGENANNSDRIQRIASELTKNIAERCKKRWPTGGTIHIESIQDLVELELMRAGEHPVARSYVLYREKRREAREILSQQNEEKPVHVILENGSKQKLDMSMLSNLAIDACQGLAEVSPTKLIEDARKNLFDGVAIKDVYKALVMSARTLVEIEPNYSYVTARLLLQDIYREAMDALKVPYDLTRQTIGALYPKIFTAFIQRGIAKELLSPNLNDFDLEKLGKAIDSTRDLQFTYLSIQTLYDRYFIHYREKRIELPQVFFMRVAMGLAHCEGEQKNERAIEFYRLLSSFDYMSSTPTLFNSGTMRPQLSSCYLTTVPDCLDGIYGALKDNALLSKFAGGLGNDWTPVRAMGAYIKGTNGKSLGVVPFLNVANATAVAVNQGGKRKGAVCAYLETWHLDIEEFLELRKNTGDDRRRTHDMNTANWVPDLFMKRVFNKENWTLFSPNEVKELHDLFGDAFEKKYVEYEEKAARGDIRSKTIPALNLWRKMLTMLFETGHPWITFKDPCNLRSPQQHAGVIHSSNLCTEITLNTKSNEEIAVCNLGSINLVNHMKKGKLDSEKLQKTVKTAIRMLDNVIDINYYSVPAAKNSNLKHRPIGLGLMGFQDALYLQNIPYGSNEAIEFADRSMELMSYYAIDASSELALERGTYETYPGSLWDQGILPIDSIELLRKTRGDLFEQNTDKTVDWDSLRNKVKKQGMRNSNTMAIAPTATISNICGVSQSIEPTYQNLYVKSNLSGEFTVVNPYLVHDLKKRGLWDQVMIHDLKYYNGSVQLIDRIPVGLKSKYATSFEVDPLWLVEAGSRRQKWIDQSQSLNLYMAEPSGKKLDELYRKAWISGLKTTYYLRSLGATSTEKATINDGKLNAVVVGSDAAPKACAIDNPECEACQ
ncbi:MAG: ribonucleoside-diphosphate reductase subunit alpha [Gammaproteobacteria bacterium RIFCSPHIGHO2_02_FULL_39_13]|nr:MAG: ribonucleoside-diphosphate reductase subunit alpha [Gammaproteobacteria bacterium RIFCSPHIGHO2_02_FULL_39_13]OGT50057.1 MAG: ribonucleoside-diphosphate reductase subunit alpha [Gammaproteobacteria bacterium RIFCSPHIGHO2_12_FULL_39_24]